MEQAAEILELDVKTLRKWRYKKIGPPSFRLGGRVKYREGKLYKWIEEQEKNDPHSNPLIDPSRAPVLPRMRKAKH
ncbi:helix-turn-helix transcriptional regulator [Rhodococcus qingshengii]|uniref:helix-turn-helix transcriptional regulator n=1 Tax=Rhodococcus qingshengii TaxID=334542 RepID=UPI0035DA635C